ncbi:MAG: hypothetical protein RTU30_07075 [Candidatus Thorarchaeota archaeon]
MTEDTSIIRWKLDALKTEYNQHWSHFRHAIDKSYQAFNIHMVIIALLFSAVTLANEQQSTTLALPLYIVIGLVAFMSTEGAIATLVVQRSSYVLYRKVIDVLRERISKTVDDILQPEVEFFYDLRIFKPGTAWFNRVNFVVLTGCSVTVLCTYLTLGNFSSAFAGFELGSEFIFLSSVAIFLLSAQKFYYSVIHRSNERARSLYCKMQNYDNPPTESREIKALKRYSTYLMISVIIIMTITVLSLIMAIATAGSGPIYVTGFLSVIYVTMFLMSCIVWRRTRCELSC